MGSGNILKEGSNCWRIEHADRVAFLVDAAFYFECLADAFERARHSIYIAGWDIDSRIPLLPSGDRKKPSERFSDLINAKVDRTPSLEVHILCWDYAMIYVMEREWLTMFNIGLKNHKRTHFKTDAEHPLGASHHQKIVVVDGILAFSGGIDITNSRWDTPAHLPEDSRRRNPDGNLFHPFHDVQMAVDGKAASALGDLFRLRWQWATGREIPSPTGRAEAVWPERLTPDITDTAVGIARTIPAYGGRKEVREVERLYQDMIRSAQEYIYTENQYLTSSRITEALAERLAGQDGPEIILILPEKADSWLAQSTMDAFRIRNLRRLVDADEYDRLRALYPVTARRGMGIYVHSKVMVVDNRIVRVGSANLTNRSMGLDTECDLIVEAGKADSARMPIRGFLHRLLAEHLGTTTERVEQALEQTGSLIGAVESLSGGDRTLLPVDLGEKLPIDGLSLVPDEGLLDPESPVGVEELMDQFNPRRVHSKKRVSLIKPALFLAVLLALAASWRWTPLSRLINMEVLTDWGHFLAHNPYSPLIVLGAYLLGSLVMVPVTLLVGATAIVFGAFPGSVYALGSCLLSAMVFYGVGAKLGRDALSRFTGGKLHRVSTHLARQGIFTIILARNLPIAPFSLVNMVAGASQIGFNDFILGTAVGMAPGILGITLFTERFLKTVQHPDWFNIVLVAAVAAILIAGIWWIKRRLF